MCRSQDIPCTLTKGYAGSSYHAWNKVNVSGNWYQIDMTYAVTKRVINETTFAGCVLHPAERHARRVRGGVKNHNSSNHGGRYFLPPFFSAHY